MGLTGDRVKVGPVRAGESAVYHRLDALLARCGSRGEEAAHAVSGQGEVLRADARATQGVVDDVAELHICIGAEHQIRVGIVGAALARHISREGVVAGRMLRGPPAARPGACRGVG